MLSNQVIGWNSHLIIHNIAQILWRQSEKSLKATSNKRNSFYLKTQHFYNHVNYFAKPSLWTTAYKLMNECIIDFYETDIYTLIVNWMWTKHHISMLSFSVCCHAQQHSTINSKLFALLGTCNEAETDNFSL